MSALTLPHRQNGTGHYPSPAYEDRIGVLEERVLTLTGLLNRLTAVILDDPDDDTVAQRAADYRAEHPRHTGPALGPITDPAGMSVSEIMRAIGARAGCADASVRDAIANSPHFRHLRDLGAKAQCGDCDNCQRYGHVILPGDGTGAVTCVHVMRLLVRPHGDHLTRYQAIMAGDPSAEVRLYA